MSVENNKPVALLLAGYDKLDSKRKLRRKKEIIESYDGDEIYIGNNKFLYDLAGKPVIQYVIDAIYNAKKNGKRIYDKIYVYNDIEAFSDVIDLKRYPNLIVKQMTDSVGGHWKDFYFKYIDYGQRVDIFFGDIPRITTGDVEYVHDLFGDILGKKKDHRGVIIRMLFSIVKYEDLKNNWLDQRIKIIKKGPNKGKLKNFVGFEDFQARIGNSGAIIKHESIDKLMEYEAVNLLYNIRKALTPSSFSKIIYLLWKTKNFHLIKQVKNKCINLNQTIDALIVILAHLHKIDLSTYSGRSVIISKNASRWENDIDGPHDLAIFEKKFQEKL